MAESSQCECNILSTAAFSQRTFGEIENSDCLGIKLLFHMYKVEQSLDYLRILLFPLPTPQNSGFSAGDLICGKFWLFIEINTLLVLLHLFIISAETELPSDNLQRKYSKSKTGSSHVPQLINWPGSHSKPVLPPIPSGRKRTNPWWPLLASLCLESWFYTESCCLTAILILIYFSPTKQSLSNIISKSISD